MTAGLLFSAFVAVSFARAAQPLTDGGVSTFLPPDKPVLIVAHPHVHFDRNRAAKKGIDRAVGAFASAGHPVVALKVCDLSRFWEFGPTPESVSLYTADQSPSAIICSSDGKHSLQMRAENLFIAGGFDNRCLLMALLDAIDSGLAAAPSRPFNVFLIRDAIYSSGLDDQGGDIPMPTHHLGTLDASTFEKTLARMFSHESWVYSSKKWPTGEPRILLVGPEGVSRALNRPGSGGTVVIRVIDSSSIGRTPRQGASVRSSAAVSFMELLRSPLAW